MSGLPKQAVWAGAAAVAALVAYKFFDAPRVRKAAEDALVAKRVALIRENWAIGTLVSSVVVTSPIDSTTDHPHRTPSNGNSSTLTAVVICPCRVQPARFCLL